MQDTCADGGTPLPEIDECFQLAVTKLAVLANVQETACGVNRLLKAADEKRKACEHIDAAWLAKEFNHLKTLLGDYVAGEPTQALVHTFLSRTLHTCTIDICNGEEWAASSLDANRVHCMAVDLRMAKARHRAEGRRDGREEARTGDRALKNAPLLRRAARGGAKVCSATRGAHQGCRRNALSSLGFQQLPLCNWLGVATCSVFVSAPLSEKSRTVYTPPV